MLTTKYMVMSRDQNAGRSHDIKNDNSSFERVEHFENSRTFKKLWNNLNKSKFYSGRN